MADEFILDISKNKPSGESKQNMDQMDQIGQIDQIDQNDQTNRLLLFYIHN